MVRFTKQSLAITSESDEALMGKVQAGNLRAFEVLFAKHRGPVYRFAYGFVGDAQLADDLLQETFLRVVKSASSYRPTAKFTTWLFTIARNQSIDLVRRMKFRRTDPLEGESTEEEDLEGRRRGHQAADPSAPSGELRAALRAALATLPSDQREVFVLREVVGMPFAEIAQLMGVAENTLKSRMRYALEKLRLELDPMAPDKVQP